MRTGLIHAVNKLQPGKWAVNDLTVAVLVGDRLSVSRVRFECATNLTDVRLDTHGRTACCLCRAGLS
ncbi:hypothetical protein EMIT0P171_70132 [Pseudomonas sp. IT-P171]